MLDEEHPMSELKPCPFCGGEASLSGGFSEDERSIMCNACASESGWFDTDHQALAAWNRRANDWQPIETAPKDRPIEVYAPSPDPQRWHPAVQDLPPIVCLAQWHHDAGFCVCTIREVTHWREHAPPIPTPPGDAP